jgi:hypothetical protein
MNKNRQLRRLSSLRATNVRLLQKEGAVHEAILQRPDGDLALAMPAIAAL